MSTRSIGLTSVLLLETRMLAGLGRQNFSLDTI